MPIEWKPILRRWTLPFLGIVVVAALALVMRWLNTGPFNTDPPQHRVTYENQAGCAHISVLSLAPWHEVEGALQPIYDLNAEDARQQALPVTARLEDKILLYLMGRAQLGSAKPGSDPPAKPAPQGGEAAPQGQAATPGSLPDFKELTEDLVKQNPFLQYQLGTALFQEVQLINNYVRYAVRPQNYEPYLLRLQVNLMPKAQNMPYDTYVNICFLAHPDQTDRFLKKCDPQLEDVPKAIPLLVTDNLEAAQRMSSAHTLLQVALSAGGPGQNQTMEGDLSQNLEKMTREASKDLNSVYSVGRVAENMIRARFGALRTGANTFAMTPRSHCVSLLLLVPKCLFWDRRTKLMITADTSYVDAVSGEALIRENDNDTKAYLQSLAKLSNDFMFEDQNLLPIQLASFFQQNNMQTSFIKEIDKSLNRKLLSTATNNVTEQAGQRSTADDKLQINALKSALIKDDVGRQQWVKQWTWLWHQLAASTIWKHWHKISLSLEQSPTKSTLYKEQTVLLVDDRNEMVAYLSGERLRNGIFNFYLKGTANNQSVSLAANNVESLDKGRRVQIVFPSLVKTGLIKEESGKAKAEPNIWNVIAVERDYQGQDVQELINEWPTHYSFQPRYMEDKVFLTTQSLGIVGRDGKADLNLKVGYLPTLTNEKVFLYLYGAQLKPDESYLGDALQWMQGNKFLVKKSGDVTLKLVPSGDWVELSSRIAGSPAGPSLHLKVSTTPNVSAKTSSTATTTTTEKKK